MVDDNPTGNLSGNPNPTVSWNKSAYTALQNAYEYIEETSPVSAKKVKDTILSMTRRLPEHPERYPLDKFKRSNPGNYRAFEKFSLRIAYRHNEKEVRILQCRHVKQQPKFY